MRRFVARRAPPRPSLTTRREPVVSARRANPVDDHGLQRRGRMRCRRRCAAAALRRRRPLRAHRDHRPRRHGRGVAGLRSAASTARSRSSCVASPSATRAGIVSEAQAMARVQHPNVITVYDAGVQPAGAHELAYVAMELVEGRTLKQWLDGKPRTAEECARALPARRARPRGGARGRAGPPRLQAVQRAARRRRPRARLRLRAGARRRRRGRGHGRPRQPPTRPPRRRC